MGSELIKRLWCDWFHAGGHVERDPQGRINWRCITCGRWHVDPVPPEDEERAVRLALKAHIERTTHEQ